MRNLAPRSDWIFLLNHARWGVEVGKIFVNQTLSENTANIRQKCYCSIFYLKSVNRIQSIALTNGFQSTIATKLASTLATQTKTTGRPKHIGNKFKFYSYRMNLCTKLAECTPSNGLRGIFGLHDLLSPRFSLIGCVDRLAKLYWSVSRDLQVESSQLFAYIFALAEYITSCRY